MKGSGAATFDSFYGSWSYQERKWGKGRQWLAVSHFLQTISSFGSKGYWRNRKRGMARSLTQPDCDLISVQRICVLALESGFNYHLDKLNYHIATPITMEFYHLLSQLFATMMDPDAWFVPSVCVSYQSRRSGPDVGLLLF